MLETLANLADTWGMQLALFGILLLLFPAAGKRYADALRDVCAVCWQHRLVVLLIVVPGVFILVAREMALTFALGGILSSTALCAATFLYSHRPWMNVVRFGLLGGALVGSVIMLELGMALAFAVACGVVFVTGGAAMRMAGNHKGLRVGRRGVMIAGALAVLAFV
ncbi:hypothetical protein ACIBHY_28760 [Nonomuraea sp. NPDC050547]|uniref:hypothetical protein n=1 Tax=Nonomuraea sp. NPDC050547 TaxID=3364368 RepID=UPI0037B9096B